jgi:anti-sigma28 factor (negative regulator of flagellin synthesis)
MADLSRDRAEASREAREEFRDRLDLSEVAQSAAEEKADPAREARIAELKAQHDSGQLNTPARIDLAADELLKS